MPIISKINLYEQTAHYVLSVRTTINFIDYPKTAAQAYTKIMEYATQNNLLLSDGPFVCYRNADLENLDVEMGFPVPRLIPGNGEITCHAIPAQKVASGIFLGAYEESDPLMMNIMQWIEGHDYKQQGEIYHYYLNDENRPSNELLTRISIPVTI